MFVSTGLSDSERDIKLQLTLPVHQDRRLKKIEDNNTPADQSNI